VLSVEIHVLLSAQGESANMLCCHTQNLCNLTRREKALSPQDIDRILYRVRDDLTPEQEAKACVLSFAYNSESVKIHLEAMQKPHGFLDILISMRKFLTPKQKIVYKVDSLVSKYSDVLLRRHTLLVISLTQPVLSTGLIFASIPEFHPI
jgi:hypothetical protein